ncbi:hypothetical protein BHU72_08910 [Desulfuribacillus stibiiarsenatis]|uniref:Peptidase family U32 C-terminal domain-containing protein n=1 Tax=Desulfuribacillus stibiiarsenatis TaxID=1390249 RepID=A0A1E5L381_9FIRM|nr:U32 family peptidase [Desulfuribacillus stibiiarsenatis]OEH84605.1 hypothetical protein BHU72_08910 [Desulfuribacillus stibiiarsenatis]
MKKPELLSPAGNLEKLKMAVRYGADAVYIAGERFGLRKAAGNFTFQDMREGVEFAHSHQAKVYVAANIIAHNDDLVGLDEYLIEVAKTGIDAIIFADPAIYMAAKRVIPEMPLHVSTQASTTNWQTVKFWADLGVERVVLARELSLQEITEVHKNVNTEIECFVHGAMCVAYSGRCLLSNYMANRDANRGGCAQSCRWNYSVATEQNIEHANEQSQKQWSLKTEGHYLMNSRDLCMVEHIPEMIQAGITSFKIEGRMKSIHYVATVTNVYRQAIDLYLQNPDAYKVDPNWIKEIQKASHRPLSTGFYLQKPTEKEQMYRAGEQFRRYDFVGMVMEYNEETRIATVEQRNNFKVGDELEVVSPGGVHFQQLIHWITNAKGEQVDVAPHPLEIVYIPMDQPVKPYSLFRKESSISVDA